MIALDPRTTVVAGDWHGNTRWAAAAISAVGSRGARTILHLGDYGYTFEARFREAVEQALAKYDMQLLFVRGNHDDTSYLEQLERDGEGCGIVSPRVRHLQDGQRLTVGDEVAVALGGAASIDRSGRLVGISWWPDEITAQFAIDRASPTGPRRSSSRMTAQRGSSCPSTRASRRVTRTWTRVYPTTARRTGCVSGKWRRRLRHGSGSTGTITASTRGAFDMMTAPNLP